jgi:TPP-dependent pyruvate/acetoin dehydrogenase alpha subunit
VNVLQDAEARLAELCPTPFVLPLGPLAPIVQGAFSGMNKADWIVTGMRERVGAVLRGCAPERLVNGAAGAKPYKLAPTSEAPGTRALHAVGLAMASGEPVLCMLGLASAASGDVYEALNTAVLLGAPVIFLVTVHPLTDDAPVSPQLATTPARIAEAFGIPSLTVSGTAQAVQTAVANARKNRTATLIQVTLELK